MPRFAGVGQTGERAAPTGGRHAFHCVPPRRWRCASCGRCARLRCARRLLDAAPDQRRCHRLHPQGPGANRAQLSDLQKRYEQNPGDAQTAIAYGAALRASGQRAQSAAVLQQAAMRNPKDTAVLGAYGRALADTGQLQQALDVLSRAHTPDRPDWRILNVQGAVLDQMGRNAEAQSYYETALRIAPGEPSVLSNLGLSYALAKDLPRAEATLRQAVASPKADARVRQNLALVLSLEGRIGEAENLARADLPPGEAQASIEDLRRLAASSKAAPAQAASAVQPPAPRSPCCRRSEVFIEVVIPGPSGHIRDRVTPLPPSYDPGSPLRCGRDDGVYAAKSRTGHRHFERAVFHQIDGALAHRLLGRLGLGHAGQRVQQHPHHAAMGDDDGVLRDIGYGGEHARHQHGVALAAGRHIVPRIGIARGDAHRIAATQVRPGRAFPAAERDLLQPIVAAEAVGRQAEFGAQDRHGLRGAPQRARDIAERMRIAAQPLDDAGGLRRLLAPEIVQRDVVAALQPTGEVPVGLAVPDQEDAALAHRAGMDTTWV